MDDLSVKHKLYAVVKFVNEKTYSEIPSNWMNGDTNCRWPPSFTKNLQAKIKNRTVPADNWPTHEIELIKYCGEYLNFDTELIKAVLY